MPRGFSVLLRQPFNTGKPVSSEVPSMWPVAIDGHPYQVDLTEYRRRLSDAQRNQADTTNEAAESALARDAYWTRLQSSWDGGAGQKYFDSDSSSRIRYLSSKGVNPWVDEEVSLHHSTVLRQASTQTNQKCLYVDGVMYWLEGNNVRFKSPDPLIGTGSYGTGTSFPAVPKTAICTDGYNVYIGDSNAVFYCNSAAICVGFSFSTGIVDVLEYVNGSLIVGQNNLLREIDSAGARRTLYTHPDANWRWTAISAGPGCIYAAGKLGERSSIYKVGYDDVTGALQTFASVANDLASGATVNDITILSGFAIVATSKGVRLGEPQTNGTLTLGAVIDEPGNVKFVQVVDQWVYYGWSNYDNDSTGLGRIDLTRISGEFAPAFASDLMAGTTASPVQGETTSLTTYQGRIFFTVNGVGLYHEEQTYVPDGEIQIGTTKFGTIEPKMGINVELKHEPLSSGSITCTLVDEQGTTTQIGTSLNNGSTAPPDPFDIRTTRSETFALTFTIRTSDTAKTPTMKRWAIRAKIVPKRQDRITVPLLLHTEVLSTESAPSKLAVNTLEEFRFIAGLAKSGRVVNYQEGSTTYQVILENFELRPSKWSDYKSFFEHLLLVEMVTVSD